MYELMYCFEYIFSFAIDKVQHKDIKCHNIKRFGYAYGIYKKNVYIWEKLEVCILRLEYIH
jgi:hypothetical protein